MSTALDTVLTMLVDGQISRDEATATIEQLFADQNLRNKFAHAALQGLIAHHHGGPMGERAIAQHINTAFAFGDGAVVRAKALP